MSAFGREWHEEIGWEEDAEGEMFNAVIVIMELFERLTLAWLKLIGYIIQHREAFF